MVGVGDEMRNPRSGERFVWRATRDSTGGAFCEFDLHLDAGASVPARHRHPHQEERFTVVTGALQLEQEGGRSRLEPGRTGVIPVDVAHRWGNAADGASHVVVRLTPALRSEEYFATFCAVATAGRAAAPGIPRDPFQLAVLMDAHRAEFVLASRTLQRVVGPAFAVLAAVGRRLGYSNEAVGRRPRRS